MTARLRPLVAGLVPPLLLRLLLRRKPDFAGVYERFADVPDDDAWAGEYWLRISRQKLEQVRAYPKRTVPPGVHACHAIVAQAANSTAGGDCRVLDFGGGTGFVYYAIRDVLAEGVSWHVVDAAHLAVMAREVMGEDPRITFGESIPEERFDLLYLNTTLQYIEDPRGLLGALLSAARPETVVLTRLMAGDVPDWVTMQTVGGRRSPCRFLDLPGLIAWFAEQGYTEVLRSVEDPYDGAFAKDVPERLRIPYDVNVVLRRAAS